MFLWLGQCALIKSYFQLECYLRGMWGHRNKSHLCLHSLTSLSRPCAVYPMKYYVHGFVVIFCCVYFMIYELIIWSRCPYPPGLLHWHWGKIARVPMKLPWWVWVKRLVTGRKVRTVWIIRGVYCILSIICFQSYGLMTPCHFMFDG